MTYAPFIRIFLRYLSAALLTRGLIDGELAHLIARDPDVLASADLLVGALIGVLNEVWYARDRKAGKTT